ncbi:MAG: hypothetical protein DRN83_03320 [Hadesarchaea archaeon]|nr:MAG: hypothetical protein DRN83_03320 [Hadesarchaea archaeon]
MQDWLHLLAQNFGYLGVFLVGLVGAASVIIPVPSTVVLLGIATTGFFDPFLLAVAFGLGSAVGQLTSYVVGYAGRVVVGKKYKRRMNAMLKIFEHYGMIAVFIFALTPLPDSLLFIPMGLVHYSLLKVFVAAAAGKICMSLIITYFGTVAGQVFVESWIFGLATAIFLILVVVAIFKIDWEKVVKKYLPKNKKGKKGT